MTAYKKESSQHVVAGRLFIGIVTLGSYTIPPSSPWRFPRGGIERVICRA